MQDTSSFSTNPSLDVILISAAIDMTSLQLWPFKT